MIKHQPAHKRGFTLLEAIIYIGLFGLIFTGIFVSIYPLLTGAAAVSNNIAIEGESTFIQRKIQYALQKAITTSSDISDIVPSTGNTTGEDKLVINTNRFRFEQSGTDLLYSEGGSIAIPLNANRVKITNFLVKHPTPATGAPHYLEVSFTATVINTPPVSIGPVRYYLHF